MVASISDTPLANRREQGGKKSRCLVFLLSPETVKHHSAAAFTQVDDDSRLPHVKYRLVWQVVKVPLAHAQFRRARRRLLNDF